LLDPRNKSAGDGVEEAASQNKALFVIAALVAAIHVTRGSRGGGDAADPDPLVIAVPAAAIHVRFRRVDLMTIRS
jgi:hypothetical protein